MAEVSELSIALKSIMKSALIADGVARGLNEAVKALDKREAHFCLYAKDCDESSYEKLVRALSNEHNIPVVEVESKAELGELVGQCKLDKDGKPRKVVGCSAAVVTNYGRDDPTLAEAQRVLQEHIKQNPVIGSP